MAPHPRLGAIVVDRERSTLYRFTRDAPRRSACLGACAVVWPPYLTRGRARAGRGVDAAKLGTIERPDGSTQVTYRGSPLYTYRGDRGSGEARGEGLEQFGGRWQALAARPE